MRRTVLVAWAFALVAALAVGLPGTAFARGGDYSIDELSTEVAVETNATAHVVERQVVTFDTINSGYIWYLHAPEDGEAVRISGIRVAPVDDGGTVIGDWTRLQLVDSRPTLQGRNPGDSAALSVRGVRTQPWYSFNIGDGMVRCWFPIGADLDARAKAAARDKAEKAAAEAAAASAAARAAAEEAATARAAAEGASAAEAQAADAGASTLDDEAVPEGTVSNDADLESPETSDDANDPSNADSESSGETPTENAFVSHAGETRYVIEATYTVAHRVHTYRDVGELYWRYANSSLPVDASDVNLQVMLPVPAETEVVPNVDVMAWGHGPDSGTLEVGADGTVTCHVDAVERGNYAEAHVIFPSWWLGNIAEGSANVYTELRQAAAVAEEAQWVDASKRSETWDFKVRVLFMALAVVVILSGVIAVARFGRSARSRRALVRVAATLGIVALGEQLFFREPVTTGLLIAFAAIVAAVSLMLPANDEDAEQS